MDDLNVSNFKCSKNMRVIRRYMPTKFEKIPSKQIFDFIPNIRSPEDREILYKWEAYLRGLGIPFIITETRNSPKSQPKQMLWKERYV